MGGIIKRICTEVGAICTEVGAPCTEVGAEKYAHK